MPTTLRNTDVLFNDGTTQTSASGVARAWVNYATTTGAGVIRGAFNVSSVTYNSTGNVTINFTTAMPDTNYTVVTTGGVPTASGGDNDVLSLYAIGGLSGNLNTGSVRMYTKRQGINPFDTLYAGVAIFR